MSRNKKNNKSSPLAPATSAWILTSLIPVFAQVNLPATPVVTHGSVSIDHSNAALTTITQSSQKAVINWDSFSIATGNAVHFIQPDRSAIAVNRVTGSGWSQIDGSLTANGQVWILNPNGVLIGSGGLINTAGFLATTRALSDSDFTAGRYSFTDPAQQGGQIINRGSISALTGGYVTLAGQQVKNAGLIQANLGQVVLGGAQTFTLDIAGDKLLSFAVTKPVSFQSLSGAALVENSGVLQADGGRVQLTARAAADVIGGVINTSGLVQANTAQMVNGSIVLDAGLSGTVNNTGTLSASGTSGGHIEVSGKQIIQTGSISADGTDGNGGNGGSVQLLASESIYSAGSISANAGPNGSGNGGSIALIADLANGKSSTTLVGSLSAQAGKAGGKGGMIETSGSILNIDRRASVNTNAPKGLKGTWLLDPGEINIVAGSGGSFTAVGTVNTVTDGSVNYAGSTGNTNNTVGGLTGSEIAITSSIGVEKLVQALGLANVVIATDASLSGSGDINVNAPLSWSVNTLTLKAHNNINVNASMDAGSGALNFIFGLGTDYGVGSGVNVASNAEILIPNAGAYHWQKGALGSWNSLALMNEYLRFGDGTVTSFNYSGAPVEPYYRDQSGLSCASVDGWCKATFMTTPLSFAIGLAAETTSTNDTLQSASVIYMTQDAYTQTPYILNQLTYSYNQPYTLPTLKLNIAGYKLGTGSIEARYAFSFENADIKVSNTYALQAGDRFMSTTTAIKAGASDLSGIKLWTGISDDWVANLDSVVKTKGTLTASGFAPIDMQSEQGNTVHATDLNNTAVVLLHSSAKDADAVLGETFGSFSQIVNKEPSASAPQIYSDGAYGIFLKLNGLAAQEEVKTVTYFGAALKADEATLADQITKAVSLEQAGNTSSTTTTAVTTLLAELSLQPVVLTTVALSLPTSVVSSEPVATTSAAVSSSSVSSAPASTTGTAVTTATATLAPAVAATVTAPAPAASLPLVAAIPAPATGAVTVSSPVVLPPPSPVGSIKPPTPRDAADTGDRTLSAAAPPPAPVAATNEKRSVTLVPNIQVGMVSVQTVQPEMPQAVTLNEQRFSLGGNSSAW